MFSTPDLCHLAGLTFRQADYWIRRGALIPVVPAAGSGSQREFDATEIQVARVLVHLRFLGADLDVLCRVAAQLRLDPLLLPPGVLYVDPEGWCSLAPRPLCWCLDLQPVEVLTSA